jgi:DNA invertase Pin-like site-specific DNA recombinase
LLDQLEAGDVLTVTRRLDRLARSTRDLLKPETPDDRIDGS